MAKTPAKAQSPATARPAATAADSQPESKFDSSSQPAPLDASGASPDSDVAPRKRGRRGRRGGKGGTVHPSTPGASGPAGSDGPDLSQRAERVLSEIRKLCHALGEEFGMQAFAQFPVERIELPVVVDLHRKRAHRDDRAAAEVLLGQVRRRVRSALQSSGAVLAGQVFCFQCESARCEHSEPPDRRCVFAGYLPTGKPTWKSFTNLCLDLQDDRVDQLYADPPDIIAVVHDVHSLRGERLEAFGRDHVVFELLGQVSLGLVPVDFGAVTRAGVERFAFSVQIVETHGPKEPRRLVLHPVGLESSALVEAATAQGARGVADRLRQTLREAQHRVDGLSRRAREARQRGDVGYSERSVASLLADLRGDLERVFRAQRRRTAHGQERHQSGERPTGNALQDTRAAGVERFRRDVHKNTIVVLGPKGRTHVFTQDGKLVTSLQLAKADVERRLDLGRWVPVSADEAQQFLARIP